MAASLAATSLASPKATLTPFFRFNEVLAADGAEMVSSSPFVRSPSAATTFKAFMMPSSSQATPETGADMEAFTSTMRGSFSQSALVAAESHAPSSATTQVLFSFTRTAAAGSRSTMSSSTVSGKTRFTSTLCTQAFCERRCLMPSSSRRSSVESSGTAAMRVISWSVRCETPETVTFSTWKASER